MGIHAADFVNDAVQTVKDFMKKETSIKKVIFNVFKETDRAIYRELLR